MNEILNFSRWTSLVKDFNVLRRKTLSSLSYYKVANFIDKISIELSMNILTLNLIENHRISLGGI